jgi:hypothetical protein
MFAFATIARLSLGLSQSSVQPYCGDLSFWGGGGGVKLRDHEADYSLPVWYQV